MIGKGRIALLALASLLAGCEREVAGFLSCGDEVCGPRQECVTADGQPSCACLSGYVGQDCDVCEFGYRRTLEGGCELIPIDCNEEPSVCGDHGQCTSSDDGDFCSCGELYEGRLCQSCTAGHQDNDQDGSCEPTCTRADLDCVAPTRCSDVSGTAECVCPIGFVGEQCDQCALGYRDSDGTCVLTCDAAGLSCGPREVCDDSGNEPECVCQEGYSGPSCDGCASGYLADPLTDVCLPSCDMADIDCGVHGECSEALGFAACQCDLSYAGEGCDRCAEGYALEADDVCVFAAPATHTLLAAATLLGQPTLVAIDPATGDAVTVGEQDPGALATGATVGGVFSFDGEAVSLLDLPSGERSIAVSGVSAQPALAYDGPRERLYAIHSGSPHPLLWIDPAAGSVAPQGDTGLGAVLDLAYDALNDRVLVLGEGLFAVDPSSAEVTPLPEPPPATRGIAFGADGTLYALSASDLTAEAARIDACQKSALGLGLLGYDTAPGSVVEPNADDATFALDSVGAAEPEVVAYLGRGVSAEQRTVTITSDNENAVFCLEIREPTTLVVLESTRFRTLIAYTLQSEVQVEVDFAFMAAESPAIHLGATVPAFTVLDVGDWVREYTAEEWQTLKLPIDPRFYAPGPGVLHVLDATFASTSSVTLPEQVRPFGTLTAWAPPP